MNWILKSALERMSRNSGAAKEHPSKNNCNNNQQISYCIGWIDCNN